MISKKEIKRNIRFVSSGYKRCKHPLRTLLYSKMAVIEVGGWVELSMDYLVKRAGAGLVQQKNIDLLDKDIIKNTWGFDYDSNFRKMLIRVIGLTGVEKIEEGLDVAKFTKMNAAIQLLKSARNAVAHTYINPPGVTTVVPAPSLTNSYFLDIYDGLANYEKVMKKLKLI